MVGQTTSEIWNSRWSATERTVDRESPEDNFYEEYPTLAMHRKSGMQVVKKGGKEISKVIQTSGSSAQTFDGYDPLSKTPVDPYETAHYKWRYYAVPIILSDTEDWENGGEEQIFDLLTALNANADSALLKKINEDILGDQSGKEMLGYQDHMATAAGETLGGIDSSATTAWESQRDTTSTTFTTQTVSNIFDGVTRWSSVLDKCRIQGGNISNIVTTHSIVRAYRIALSSHGYGNVQTSNATGIGGPMNPAFYTSAVIADNDCSALHSYFVDTRHLKLNVLSKANFKKTPFVSLQSNGQLAQLAYKVAGVQLVNNNRRRSGVATALTGA